MCFSDLALLDEVAARFTGALQQVPPMHSALKKEGRALYDYARAGLTVERLPRSIVIHSLTLSLAPEQTGYVAIKMNVVCSKGTYIRTLGEDIGEALGCGAHLVALRRTSTGGFGLAPAISLAALEALPESERLDRLLPVDALLSDHTTVTLDADNAGRFLSGVRRRGSWPDAAQVAVYGALPRALLGSAHVRAGELIPGRLLSPVEIEQILEAGSPAPVSSLTAAYA